MDDDDKPFECTIPGCGQRFANNDHLAVHKQKHQLRLSLGTPRIGEPSCGVMEDQTPTPTRFLKNLDESGLFADLERDNPFDQEFKRVSHSEQNGKTKQRAGESQERSNNAPPPPPPPPSVIIMDQSETSNSSALSSTHVQVIATTAGNDAVKLSQSLPMTVRCIPAAIPASIANPNIPVPAAHSAITTSNHIRSGLHIPVTSMSMGSSPLVTSPGFMSSAKQRLKESLRQQSNTNIISRAMTEATSQLMDVSTDHMDNGQVSSERHHHHSESKKALKRAARRSQEELDPDMRRRKFLERNRAAATRCREKRKIWVTQLEKKAEDLNQTNSQLQGEIALLRTEVAQLKALLLAHKECPVTLQQQKMGGMVQAGHVINSTNGPFVALSTTSLAEDTAKSALMQMAAQTVSQPIMNMNTITVVTLPQ